MKLKDLKVGEILKLNPETEHLHMMGSYNWQEKAYNVMPCTFGAGTFLLNENTEVLRGRL